MIETSPLTRRCGRCGYRFEATTAVCPIDRVALAAEDPGVPELGSYRLVERLGEGGMGAVYRAIHRKLGRTVAIKVLQKDLTRDRGIINRFFHEARAANTIRHEHVIQVYDFVEADEDIYFVMELLRGRDLHDTIHRRPDVAGPIDPERAVRILEQVAAGLHATHTRDIVHRDLKPENIFLCHKNGVDEFVKIIDFGIAKLERPDGLSTVAGTVLGTPEYIAPEQARGFSNLDGRADVYSLGCIAYEMLTRHQLFGGGTRAQILTRQIKLTPPGPRAYVPTLPAALDAAVMRALAKDPAARPATARAFAESLAWALGRDLHDAAAFRAPGRRGSVEGRRTPTSPALVLRAMAVPPARSCWRSIAAGAVVASLFAVAVASGKHAARDPWRRSDPLAPVAAMVAVPDEAPSTVLTPSIRSRRSRAHLGRDTTELREHRELHEHQLTRSRGARGAGAGTTAAWPPAPSDFKTGKAEPFAE